VRIVAVFDDLLLGSNVLGMLRAAGHEATLASPNMPVDPDGCDVLVVDLASTGFDGVELVDGLRAELGGTKLLGVHSHVQPEQRERALAAGFDMVVPRSRMAREGAAVVLAVAGADE
jgi:DNA-binding NarL/FixJ family response regulator